MVSLLRHAWQPLAPVTTGLGATSISLTAWAATSAQRAMYHRVAAVIDAGTGRHRCAASTVRTPGKAKRLYCLSLVNRAVKSNIFMNGWDSRFTMSPWRKWTNTTGALCTVCGEYETCWISAEGSGFCKYCHWEQRTQQAPVPEYMKEMIPLD